MEVSLVTLFKFFAGTMGVLAIIFVALVLTPRVGRYIDDCTERYRKRHPKPQEDERLYLVRSPFDGNHTLDMDRLYEQEKARREACEAEASSDGVDGTLEDNSNGDVYKNG